MRHDDRFLRAVTWPKAGAMTKTLNIGVIGAGIGGLSVASLLARDGHKVSVFDQFDRPRPLGSGLVIQPVGQAVLDELSLLDDALALGTKITSMSGHEADHGRLVLNVSYAPRFGLAIHRASLFNLLLKLARKSDVTLIPEHAATDIRDGIISFGHGKDSTQFDLVIDASGANSGLSQIKAKSLPYGAIWGTVPWPDTTRLPGTELRQCYRQANRMMGVLPIGQVPGRKGPQAAIFWSMPTGALDRWPSANLSAWKAEASGLWPEFQPFLETITAPAQMTPASYSHGTLRKPYSERLAIIGDSAHRASPQLGQGANMALLDTLALRQALRQSDVAEALRHYAMARRWHIRIYQAMSWAFTPQYQSDSAFLPALRDRVIFPFSQMQPIPKLLTRLVCGDMLPPLGSLTER